MNAGAKQASLVIESVMKAVANWTVDRHAEMNPQLPGRYGSSWRTDWIGHTTSQLHLLAQSVSVRSRVLFASLVRWALQSFQARGVDGNDLKQNMICMREVLEKELPEAVRQIALEHIDAAVKALESSQGTSDFDVSADAALSREALQYLEAVLEGDRIRAESLIFAAHRAGSTVPDLYEHILAPAQAQLGGMWHRGEITVADEHFGSAITETVMAQLRPHFNCSPANGRSVVATSPPGDLHEIGLRMVANLFEIDGWNVFYLGANTPSTDLIELLERRCPDLVALSVSTALTLRDAGELIEKIRGTSEISETKVLIGGTPLRAVAELWRELGADGCARSAVEAVELGNKLTTT